MDKSILIQYRALQKEVPKLRKDIERLYERLDNLPVVSGKITKSADEFPYIEEHLTVQMVEPCAATEIKRQIRIKEMRIDKAEKQCSEIEEFIASIPDSTNRQIFELSFLKGMNQVDIAEEVGMERSNVSKRIRAVLKLSHISQK